MAINKAQDSGDEDGSEEEEHEEILAGINGHDAQVGGADEETHCCENDDLKENHPQHKPLFVSESNYVKRLSQQMGVNVGTKHNQQNFKAKSKMRNQDVPTNPLVSPIHVNSTTVNHNNPQQLQQAESHLSRIPPLLEPGRKGRPPLSLGCKQQLNGKPDPKLHE